MTGTRNGQATEGLKYWSVAEIAAMVGVGEDTLYREIDRKKLRATRVGGRQWRVRQDWLDTYLEGQSNITEEEDA